MALIHSLTKIHDHRLGSELKPIEKGMLMSKQNYHTKLRRVEFYYPENNDRYVVYIQNNANMQYITAGNSYRPFVETVATGQSHFK